ncbi:tripartite tricarboxylate transporter permease [Candidatus Woesearchaeota archaeon]|nr:tripartite tricarboxylate transporter permease [Candidatus Woesearchaeota archaeon]
MIETLISIFLGIVTGLITGIVPSLHINLVTIIALKLLINQDLIDLFTFIITLSISNSFFNTIPLTFFSIPDSPETIISSNPANKMFSQGRSYEAFLITIIGSLSSTFLLILTTPLLIFIYPKIFKFIKPSTALLLIIIIIFLIKKEKNSKLWAIITFLSSGILGILTLTNYNLKEPLLPLLSGLFAIPSMLTSIKNKQENNNQTITQPNLTKKGILTTIPIALLVSFFSTFLPALGPSQAAVLASTIKKFTLEESLLLTGSLTTFNMLLSLVSLYSINKSRNGSIEALSNILEKFTRENLTSSLIISLITAAISTVIAILLAKKFIKHLEKIKLEKLNIFFLILTLILIFIFSNFHGLLIALIGTSIGFIPILKNVNRNHLMGCIILPVIFYTIK